MKNTVRLHNATKRGISVE